MTVEPPVRNDYRSLAAHFQSVRSAWKRAAALSGAAVVMTEGLGIFVVLLFLDWLFQPQTAFRFCLWALALGGIGYFLFRHVIRPLFRKIPDEQIALYIEERRTDLDGVLITAAEYGRERTDLDAGQSVLIDAIIREATTRSGKLSLRRVADFSRLRKYGVIAAISMGVFVLLGLLFPNVVGHRMERVLAPWKATPEQTPDSSRPQILEPIRFDLSRTDAKLQRGGSFELDAALSRSAGQDVMLNFRPATGDAVWQSAPMSEVEKLNGYHGVITDISEDLDFYVSSGAHKSETHRITVFDPLVVQSMETTAHPPEYTRLPDQTENPSTGDIAALIGSKVSVRIHTNTPLKDGEVKWSNGQTQPVKVDASSSGEFNFEVKENASYDFRLTDVNGQQTSNSAPLSVQAIPDEPPTLEVKSPVSPVMTHPLGEVQFEVMAGDDFGLDSVTLAYTRLDPDGKPVETRVPLALEPSEDTTKRATYRLMLEDAKPLFKSEEAITYHLEAKDTKGQTVSSEIGFIIIGYYETWGTWADATSAGGGAAPDEGPDLMTMLSLVWTLDGQKSALAPTDLQAQSKELAAKMVTTGGAMRSFVDLAKMPQLAKVAKQIGERAKAAHDALEGGNTTAAATELSIAAALYAGNGILADITLKKMKPSSGAGSSFHLPSLTMLEQKRLEALKPDTNSSRSETDSKNQTAAAAAAGKKLDSLVKEQEAISKKAKEMESAAGEGAAGADPKKAGELAKEQRGLAEKTRAAANELKAAPSAAAPGSKMGAAAKKTAEAAETMLAAGKDIAAGKGAEGAAKAAKAKGQLEEAAGILADTSRDKLETAISEAEAMAEDLLEKQKSLRGESEIVAGELESGKPADQRQQRDLQTQAFRETELRAGMENLTSVIGDLAKRAEQVGQAEAIRGLTEAQKIIKGSQPAAKMGNAAINLNGGSPGLAVVDQKKAEDALTRLIASFQKSSDALAASKGGQLRRAARSAADANASLNALGKGADGKGVDGKGADGKGADGKGADGKGVDGKGVDGKGADGKGADGKGVDGKGADGKGADGKGVDGKGADGKGADGKGVDGKGVDGKGVDGKGTDAKGVDGKSADGKGADAKGADGKGEDGKGSAGATAGNQGGGGSAQKVSFKIQRLIDNLDNRGLAPQAQIDRLKDLSLDKAELEKRLLVDPTILAEVTGLVADIRAKLEAETTARSEAGSLQASQREECPPSYRQFVNQYFETLSRTSQAPAAKPEP